MDKNLIKFLFFTFIFVAMVVIIPQYSQAISSSSYQIPQYQLPQGGGTSDSSNFELRSTITTISGVAASDNYSLDTAFPSVTGVMISLNLDSANVNLGSLTPGSPITGTTTATVATNSAAGYTLAIQKDKLMTHTDTTTTISDFTGTIGTPTTYTNGVDEGLGFTVSAGTNVDSKWSGGTKFAAIPTQIRTTYHSLISSISSPNNTTITYKLDVPASQKPGSYSTSVAIFATPLP